MKIHRMFSSVINLLIHCLFSLVLMLASQVFFKVHYLSRFIGMQYALISFSIREKIYFWLFHPFILYSNSMEYKLSFETKIYPITIKQAQSYGF